jgi:hypothetical protein
MITDADIKKMKAVFATKDDLKAMATKEELKAFDSKVDLGFTEIVKFIGEMKVDIVSLLSKQINDFRDEMCDINHNSQSILNNHEPKIAHLEYADKS